MRDYARRGPHYQRSSRRPEPTQKMWPSILLGILCGAILAGAVSWHFFVKPHALQSKPMVQVESAQEEALPTLEPKKPSHKARRSKKVAEQEEPPEARFDFYTLLPNTVAETPDVAAPPETTDHEKDYLSFIVQAGSFETESAADSLKATLAMQGFEPKVQRIPAQNGHTWYRVYLGPFLLEQDALAQQSILHKNAAPNSLVLKIYR